MGEGREERVARLLLYEVALRHPGDDSIARILGSPFGEFGISPHSVTNDSLIHANSHDFLVGWDSIFDSEDGASFPV